MSLKAYLTAELKDKRKSMAAVSMMELGRQKEPLMEDEKEKLKVVTTAS